MAKGKGVRSLSEMMAEKAAKAAPASPVAASPPPEAPAFTDEAAPVPINIYVTDADRHRLRQFALERRTTVQALGHRAWNLLLAEEGLPPLAPATSYVPVGRKRRGG